MMVFKEFDKKKNNIVFVIEKTGTRLPDDFMMNDEDMDHILQTDRRDGIKKRFKDLFRI